MEFGIRGGLNHLELRIEISRTNGFGVQSVLKDSRLPSTRIPKVCKHKVSPHCLFGSCMDNKKH